MKLSLPVAGIFLGMAIAYLLVRGDWPIAMVLIFALPGMIILHRYPFAAIMIWLLLNPFLVDTSGGVLRNLYWVIHRALPPAALAVILLSYMLRTHPRRLPRLGLPELAMLGYLGATQLSVLYLSDDVLATTYFLYDHIFVPMCLFFVIRLVKPDEQDVKRLLPVLLFLLLSQSVIGALSWIAPQTLPSSWLERAGSRTSGSLDHYSVFTSTLIFCGLLLVHSARNHKLAKATKAGFVLALPLTFFMVFISFSRGSWLASLLVLMGLMLLYPRFMIRFGMIFALVSVVVAGSGILEPTIEYAQRRFYSDGSEESALSRLPVVYASLRMFANRPLFGWGYENFDKYDYEFQERVGELVTPEKDHASHNLYLTILAEQGATGLLLYLTPVFWLLAMTVKVLPKMPAQGFWSRKLLFILWLVVIFHVVVNNFSNMRVVFGLGMWWLNLGLIARVVTDYLPHRPVHSVRHQPLPGQMNPGFSHAAPQDDVRQPAFNPGEAP